MKILTSNTEGVWFDPIHLPLSEEDTRLINSTSDVDVDAKAILFAATKVAKENPATTEDATISQTVYEFHKPVLKETDTYELIEVVTRIEGTNMNGIINCRINNEHTQIRF
jgi:hypothetical protein